MGLWFGGGGPHAPTAGTWVHTHRPTGPRPADGLAWLRCLPGTEGLGDQRWQLDPAPRGQRSPSRAPPGPSRPTPPLTPLPTLSLLLTPLPTLSPPPALLTTKWTIVSESGAPYGIGVYSRGVIWRVSGTPTSWDVTVLAVDRGRELRPIDLVAVQEAAGHKRVLMSEHRPSL